MLEIYGLAHILYLLITVPLFVFVIYVIKKKVRDPRKMDNIVRIIGGIYLAVMVWNRVSTSVIEVGFKFFLPNLYCGISGIVLSLSMIFLKRDHFIYHCVIYISILGGLLTMIYPDFIVKSDSLFYQPTISGLLHHSLLLFIPLMLVYIGYVKPDIKKYHILPFGMAVYITFGVFQMTVLGYEDAMYLFNPVLEGTMFDWFGFALLFLPAHFLFLVVWHYLPLKYKPTSIYEHINLVKEVN